MRTQDVNFNCTATFIRYLGLLQTFHNNCVQQFVLCNERNGARHVRLICCSLLSKRYEMFYPIMLDFYVKPYTHYSTEIAERSRPFAYDKTVIGEIRDPVIFPRRFSSPSSLSSVVYSW